MVGLWWKVVEVQRWCSLDMDRGGGLLYSRCGESVEIDEPV